MIKKLLEKKVEISTDENQILFNSPIKLEYYLLESELEQIDELKGIKVFGIEVIKKLHGVEDEIISYKDYSSNVFKTKDLLNILANNSVTPVGVSYVLEDIMGL